MSLRLLNNYDQKLTEREQSAEQLLEVGQKQNDAKIIKFAEIQRKISKGTRDGIRKAGATSRIKLVDGQKKQPDGRIVIGLFDRKTGEVGVAAPEEIAKTVDASIINIESAVRERVVAVITHEDRHRLSWERAWARGELGMIAKYLGPRADLLFQELMASYGTEGHDAYDVERAEAIALAARIGLSAQEVIDLLFEGREADIVQAAFVSGYLKHVA